MTMHLPTTTRQAAVRLQSAAQDIAARVDDAARRRTDTWRDDGQRGSQTAEYAMLGGVSAAACSALVAILKNKETLSSLVDSVITTLGKVVEGWF